MSRPLQVWLVYHNRDDFFNVIVAADGREEAKRLAQDILKGNPDTYVVTPVTESGSRTVFLMTAEPVRPS